MRGRCLRRRELIDTRTSTAIANGWERARGEHRSECSAPRLREPPHAHLRALRCAEGVVGGVRAVMRGRCLQRRESMDTRMSTAFASAWECARCEHRSECSAPRSKRATHAHLRALRCAEGVVGGVRAVMRGQCLQRRESMDTRVSTAFASAWAHARGEHRYGISASRSKRATKAHLRAMRGARARSVSALSLKSCAPVGAQRTARDQSVQGAPLRA